MSIENLSSDKNENKITHENLRNVNIDCTRILAAFMVLMVHIGQHTGLNDYTYIGNKGVQLFFIISGYLIFHSLANSKNIFEYYKKRLLRIIPVYYLFLIIIYIYDIFYYSYFYSMTLTEIFSGPCSYKYLRYFLFLQGILPSDNWVLWNNRSALWTLSSFFVFYLIAPFIYKMTKKYWHSFFLLMSFLFFTPLIKHWTANLFFNYPNLSGIEFFLDATPLSNLYCFLFGSTLYYAVKDKKTSFYGFIIICSLVITQLSWYPYELLFTALVLILVEFRSLSKNPKTIRRIHFLSSGSFALYLCHPPILQISNIICSKLGFNNGVTLVFLLATTILGSYAFYYFIVNPMESKLEKRYLS